MNIELCMICEYPRCNNPKGRDYIRLQDEQEKGWESELIFLCDKHAKGHIPFPDVYPNLISKQNT